jgi:hypothetical protein
MGFFFMIYKAQGSPGGGVDGKAAGGRAGQWKVIGVLCM